MPWKCHRSLCCGHVRRLPKAAERPAFIRAAAGGAHIARLLRQSRPVVPLAEDGTQRDERMHAVDTMIFTRACGAEDEPRWLHDASSMPTDRMVTTAEGGPGALAPARAMKDPTPRPSQRPHPAMPLRLTLALSLTPGRLATPRSGLQSLYPVRPSADRCRAASGPSRATAAMAAKKKVTIDITSDTVCPWCKLRRGGVLRQSVCCNGDRLKLGENHS